MNLAKFSVNLVKKNKNFESAKSHILLPITPYEFKGFHSEIEISSSGQGDESFGVEGQYFRKTDHST